MKRLFSLILIIVLIGAAAPVRAQGYIILITRHPMTSEVRTALETWLLSSAPVPAPYYAETYIQQAGSDFFVSLVALNISSADEEWHLTEEKNAPGKVLWIGSVRVQADGIVIPLFEPVAAGSAKQASPRRAGGGSYVLFPIDAGTFVVYGPRGVHGDGDYGTSGMRAVDLVSGDDMGGSAASDAVYASDAGTIDYVCSDAVQVAVRTHNETTGDYFLYAHLLTNANLTMAHSFSQSELIGNLKHGSFDDDCGWAEQQSNHYHVHWMFTPASGAFQAEGCILTISTQKWTCGTDTVGIGGQLYGGGGSSSPGETGDDPGSGTSPGSQNREKGFWDYFTIAIASIWDATIGKTLPEHNTSLITFFSIILNAFRLALRIAYVVVHFNINLYPLMFILIIALGIKGIFFIIWLIAAILRAWKSLIPILGA